jgi:hypothetical protein
MSNWIVEQFEALKTRIEAHIPATNKALNDLDARVTGAESYTQQSAASLDSRLKVLESAAAAKAPTP